MTSNDSNGSTDLLVPSQAVQSGNSGRQRRPRRRGKPRPTGETPDDGKKPPGAKVSGDNKPSTMKSLRKKYSWRDAIPPGSVDPITLDKLGSLPYVPFALAATEPYEPVFEWPVPESHVVKEPEMMTAEERQRRIIEEQWGPIVMASETQVATAEKQETSKRRHYNLFDGRALAYYLVSQLQFIDPLNRRDLTRDELLNLDAYLVKHGFTDIKVVDAYDAKGVTVSKAGALGNTAAGRAAILQQEAQVLLNAMFGGGSRNQLQQQYAASQRRQQTTNRRNRSSVDEEDTGIWGTEDGGVIIIDDDANPGLRGRGLRDVTSVPTEISSEGHAAPNTLWSASHITRNYSHSARVQAHNFPSLPSVTATSADSSSLTPTPKDVSGKGPSRSLQRITQVVLPTDPAELKRQKKARDEAQRRAMLANLSMAPRTEILDSDNLSLVPAQAPAVGPTEGQLIRNQAVASALGVAPSTVRHQVNAGWARPTEGALDEFGNELNAAQYPDSLILEARERMEQLLKLERRWKAFLMDDKSASLPLRPMDRALRTFVHEYSDFWKLHTESFDKEPKRYIQCVKLRDTSAPVPLLSDVARTWRGPAPVSLPRGPRETISDHASKQTAGQATRSHSNKREFPPAPPREPLKLKPRSVPSQEYPRGGLGTLDIKVEDEAAVQLNRRFDALFMGRERPKLELAPRSVPLELPPYKPSKVYNVTEEREQQQSAMAIKAQKEREEAERKAKILAYAFASSDEEQSLASAGSSEWEEAVEQFSGSDSEEL